jgi:hypothetical protein
MLQDIALDQSAVAPQKHTFTLTVDLDPFWVEYLTQNSDIFYTSYAGYWLRGAAHDPTRGWLCWESCEKQYRFDHEPDRSEALRAWEAGEPLPDGWHRLDTAAALRAWEEGVKRWGVNWYDKTDSEREDVVVQLALLGEIRYG